ncbi:MAG: hypothetical protein JO202_12925 [Ktedonobacteraceae bacterium]|nr:hypothetical protein [Ktedonobacteraceae bacterium]
MTKQTHESALLSRRMALATLAAMPLGLVPAILAGQRSPLVLEEFLPECTASLTACWHAMIEEEDFTTIATQVPKYLPALELLAQQPSRYQKTAAHLTTQGYLLMYHVALGNLNLPLTQVYCRRAERYSRIAEDQALSLEVMTRLAYTFLDKSLSVYEKALAILSDPHHQISASLQHKIFMQAAACYAQNGQVQNALRCLEKTRETPLEQAHDEPIPSGCRIFSTLSWGAQTYEYLGNVALSQGLSKRPRVLYTAVHQTLTQVEKLDSTILVPEHVRVEVILHQAKTAIDLGEMDMFQMYFQTGAQRAKGLSGQRHKQAAIDNWKLARLRWPDEVVIKDLADLLS